MSSATDAFVTENRDRFLSELKDFIRIPSISTLPEHAADIDRAANFVAESLRTRRHGERRDRFPPPSHPLVYADWLHAPGKPTVLCYGHYDVQPADPLELWVTPPSSPPSATATSTPAARWTTRARCTCTSRPSKPCVR